MEKATEKAYYKKLVSPDYINQLIKLHEDPKFGKSSRRKKDKILSLGFEDILDYGCGKAKLKVRCRRYDPAVPEYSKLPSPADLVVCTDVLEHVEPEFLDNVLYHIKSLTKKKAYFTISCNPAKKTLPDGRNAHLIVRIPKWWEIRLSEFFKIEERKVFSIPQVGRLDITLEILCAPL